MTVTTRDGRRLHAERLGTGSPVVVFEAGMGLSRNSWGAVAPAVAERTTAVVYDRSGLGRSAPDPAVRDLGRLAGDLLDVIAAVTDSPAVLVGHSWGGPIIRTAAATAPDRVVGLVLVDQTDEHCATFFTSKHERQRRFGAVTMPWIARTGLLRRVVRKQAERLPEPWASGMREEDGTVAAMREQVAELRPSGDEMRRIRDHPLPLPDVPITVISGTKAGFMEKAWRGELVAAHKATAAAHRQGRHVNADRSSHYVPFTEPELIVNEILRIVDTVN